MSLKIDTPIGCFERNSQIPSEQIDRRLPISPLKDIKSLTGSKNDTTPDNTPIKDFSTPSPVKVNTPVEITELSWLPKFIPGQFKLASVNMNNISNDQTPIQPYTHTESATTATDPRPLESDFDSVSDESWTSEDSFQLNEIMSIIKEFSSHKERLDSLYSTVEQLKTVFNAFAEKNNGDSNGDRDDNNGDKDINNNAQLEATISAQKVEINTMKININKLENLLSNQKKELGDLRTNSDNRIKYLERSVASLQKESHIGIELLNAKVLSVESELTSFQQYNRRESVEISGVPENIPQKDLEKVMIGVLRRVGVWGLESHEIVACHRLKRMVKGEETQRVIIRFMNRKRVYQCLLSRQYLRDTIWEFPGIYAHESLCHKYKDLYDECVELKSIGLIKKMWTHNGIIHVKKTDNFHEWPIKIFNEKHLIQHFVNPPI